MLVSIIVITYNSSRYVLETLESAYRQTYANIELIVSDDCSTDNTFTLCQEWVEAHKDRFVRTLCTQTPHNGGICWNYNHALQHAQGEWIKYIAGDDILLDNCIEGYLKHLTSHCMLYACAKWHAENCDRERTLHPVRLIAGDARTQTRFALRYIQTAEGSTLFFNRKKLTELGGFDIQYPMSEDWSVTMKFLTHGYAIGIINEPLVVWRIYPESVSHSGSNTSSRFSIDINAAIRYYTLHYCWRYGLLLHQYHYFATYWIDDHYQRNKLYTTMGYVLRMLDIIHIRKKFLHR